MGIDTTSSSKGKRHKGKSRTGKPIKEYPKKTAEEDESNGNKLDEKHIQHSIEERTQSVVRQSMVSEGKSELQTTGYEDNDSATSEEGAARVTAEENIQASGSESLGEPDKKASSPSLIEMLKHKDEKVRIEALDSLLKIGDKSVNYAFASCMKDESFKVRLGALRGLYKFGGDLAIDYLISALEDKHPDVRRRAVIYLGWLRKKELVPYITDALADSSPLVRKVATYTSGDLKDVSAIPHLIRALDDTDLEVKKGALTALKRITKKSFGSELNSKGEIHHDTIVKWKEWWKSEHK